MSKNIDDIKRRYWLGETNLEEERQLKDHYRQSGDEQDITAKYLQYARESGYVTMQKAVTKPKTLMVTMRRIMSIAAMLAIVATAYFMVPEVAPRKAKNEITDPQLALEITREALSLISGKMDKNETLIKESVAQFDKTYINKIL